MNWWPPQDEETVRIDGRYAGYHGMDPDNPHKLDPRRRWWDEAYREGAAEREADDSIP